MGKLSAVSGLSREAQTEFALAICDYIRTGSRDGRLAISSALSDSDVSDIVAAATAAFGRAATLEDASLEQIAAQLQDSGFEAGAAAALAEVVHARLEELRGAASANVGMAGHPAFKTLDWSARLSLGSSATDGVRDLLLMARLDLAAARGCDQRSGASDASSGTATQVIEFSRESLAAAVRECEKIQQALDELEA